MARRIPGMGILITGASSGIGAALAAELHRRGARLALTARRAAQLDEVNTACGGGHLVLPADVADPAAAERTVQEAHARLGRLDAVVLNAGYGLARLAHETSHAEWQAILATNLLGTAAGLRAAVPLLLAQEAVDGWRGQVVVVSSGLARRAAPDTAAYSATKAAQLSLAEAARVELADRRIAVTSVHPVRTTTPFFAACAERSGRPMRLQSKVPTQDPATVARAIADAIARPRPEVWPHRLSRWLLVLAALSPSFADRIMAGHRR
jgi:NAD(P)-dependent dehydrogenase (short-subunit alcohol dehydrogenase family)